MKFTCPACLKEHNVSIREAVEPGETLQASITGHTSPPQAKDVARFISAMCKTLDELMKSTGESGIVYIDSVTTDGNRTTIRLMVAPRTTSTAKGGT